MHAVGGLALLNLAFLGGGYGVLRALGRRITAADAGLAFCIGFAVLGIGASLLAVAGYVPGVAAFLVLAAAAASPLAPLARGLRRPRLRRPSLRPSLATAVTTVLVAVTAVYAIATLVVASVKFLDEWDAWSMWTLKAKGLVVFGNLGTADFAGSAHPDYPILVPVIQSLVFRFIGSFDTQLVHVEHALLPIAFAGALARLLHRRLPSPALAVVALVVLVAPGVARNVPDALADVPVAIFVSLAGLALGLWLLDRRPSWLPLFVIFAAAATWTKDEGAASVAGMAVAAAPLAVRRPVIRSLAPLIAAVTAVVLVLLPWEVWKSVKGATYDTNLRQGLSLRFIGTRGHAAARAIDAMWGQLGDVRLWLAIPYILIAVVIAAFLLRRGRRLALFSVLAPTLAFLLYVWVYAIRTDPLGITWTLDTTVTRVTTSIGLLAAALLAADLGVLAGPPGEARELSSPGEGGPEAAAAEPA